MSTEASGPGITDPFSKLPPRELALLRGLGVTGISMHWQLHYTVPDAIVIHLKTREVSSAVTTRAVIALSDWAVMVFGLKSEKITFDYPPEPEKASEEKP